MLFIQGIKIEAFSPRMLFINHTSICDEKYGYLERAIMRSKLHRDGHNYLIGENIQMKSEFLNYKSNMLIIAEQDDEFKFIVIVKGKIFNVTNDINDQNVKMLLSTHAFDVVDMYGKRLLIKSHDDLIQFIEAVTLSRKNFNISLDKYHKFMESIYSFRNEREKSANCFISSDYNRLVDIADNFAKEMIDALAIYRDSEEQKIADRYIYKPSKQECLCALFGLYVASLRAFRLNYDYEKSSLSLNEKIRNKFQKELNYFLAENDDIFEIYAKQYALKPVEKEEIIQLFKDCGIDGEDWNMEPSEITIL